MCPPELGQLNGWKSSTKEQRHLPTLQSLEKVAPTPSSLVLTLELLNIVPPHIPCVLFPTVSSALELRMSEFVSK